MEGQKVGTVAHFFDKISVAAIDLSGDLAVGDTVAFFKGGEVLFEQRVESMQIEHEQVDSAGAGQSVGMKTTEKVREGVSVYKIPAGNQSGL